MTPEQRADRVIHALGILLGTTGAIALVWVTAVEGQQAELAPVLIYVAGLLAMLGCSAAYNVFHTSGRREWLRRFDHAAIFAMIAGT
jgi:hemolysin III